MAPSAYHRSSEPEKSLLVRLDESLYDALKQEGKNSSRSMNALVNEILRSHLISRAPERPQAHQDVIDKLGGQ